MDGAVQDLSDPVKNRTQERQRSIPSIQDETELSRRGSWMMRRWDNVVFQAWTAEQLKQLSAQYIQETVQKMRATELSQKVRKGERAQWTGKASARGGNISSFKHESGKRTKGQGKVQRRPHPAEIRLIQQKVILGKE